MTLVDEDSAGGVYVAVERDTTSAPSRPSVLRFDVSGSDTTLVATDDWNLTADLPGLGPNLRPEGVTWVPDDYLVSNGFHDEATGMTYNPASYADHGTGGFFVGVEQNGVIYAYALKACALRASASRSRCPGRRSATPSGSPLECRSRKQGYKRVKTFTVAAAAGADKVRFKGRVARSKIRRGRLRITLVATDAAGNRSASKRVRVRVPA